MKQGPPNTSRPEARLPKLTDFVVAADRAACRAIEQTGIVRLSVEDQRQIAEAILHPPDPVRALKKAFRRRRVLFGAE